MELVTAVLCAMSMPLSLVHIYLNENRGKFSHSVHVDDWNWRGRGGRGGSVKKDDLTNSLCNTTQDGPGTEGVWVCQSFSLSLASSNFRSEDLKVKGRRRGGKFKIYKQKSWTLFQSRNDKHFCCWALNRESVRLWSCLVEWVEGCIGCNLMFLTNWKNYAVDAWQYSLHVWLLGWSSCPSPSA